MNRSEMRAFIAPHLKKLGIPIYEVLEVRLMPHGWEVDHTYRDAIGVVVTPGTYDPMMNTLFINYDDDVYNAPSAWKS